MRKIIGLKFIVILLFALAGMAFSQENRGVITGRIFDAAARKPIEYANVILFSQNDSAMVTGTISGENGGFHLDKVPPGAYYIDVQFIGFKKKKLGHIEIGPAKLEIDLGKILLQQTTLSLEGVEVQGEAMAMTYQIDKKVINVGRQHTAISGTAVDVLENVPSVTVDVEGNVSLRGSSNFTVLIDGRPSILESSEALQLIPASTIDKIEIVTYPSAKYDPEGAAGIINVILKKDRREGRSGLANLNAGTGDKYSSDLLYHHKNGKYQASFGVDYNRRLFTGNDWEQNQTTRAGLTSFIQSGGSRRKDISLGLRSEIELKLSRKDVLNLGARLGTRDSRRGSALNYAEWSEAALEKLFYTGTSDRNRERHFYGLVMSYQHRFAPKGHELSAEIFCSHREGDKATTNGLLTSDAVIVSGRRTTEAGPSRDLRARLDYTLALSKKAKFEAGYQSEFDHSDDRTGLYEYDPGRSQYMPLPQFSNRTRNAENVHALYAIYAGAWGRLGYQAGWRGEYTHRAIAFNGVPTRRDFTIGRWDYFPTLHLSHQFSAGQQAMASYTRRIDRPGGSKLEPFQTWIDAYNVRVGNPALKPEYIDSYELGYQTNIGESRLSVEAYYRKTHNRIEDVRSVYAENMTLHSVENIGQDYTFGSELSLNLEFGKKWDVDLTGNLHHRRIEGMLFGETLARESFNWKTRMSNTIKLGASERIQIQLDGMYNSPSVSTQGRREGFFTAHAAMKYEFPGNLLSATLQIKDISGSAKEESFSAGADFYNYRRTTREAPVVMLNLKYNFNKYKTERNLDRESWEEDEEL